MISAIILAAGEATRFGARKQLALLDAKPLLQHSIDHVNASRVENVVLVLGAAADEIRNAIDAGRACIVVNRDYAQGMSTSIIAGINALDSRSDAAMIVLGDQPFVATPTLDRLIDEFERQRAAIMIPTYGGRRGNPVVVGCSLFGEVRQLRGDIGCRAIFGAHADSIATIDVDDAGVVTDVDTTDDLPR